MRIAIFLLLLSSASFAASTRGFGDQGSLVLSNDFEASLGYVDVGGSGAFDMTLAPSADFFVVRGVSLGAQTAISLVTGSGSTFVTGVIAPRIGVNAPLAEGISLWPRFAAGVSLAKVPNADVQTNFSIAVFVPVIFQVSGHFFVGFGPQVDAQLTGSNKVTQVLLTFTLGGWL